MHFLLGAIVVIAVGGTCEGGVTLRPQSPEKYTKAPQHGGMTLITGLTDEEQRRKLGRRKLGIYCPKRLPFYII